MTLKPKTLAMLAATAIFLAPINLFAKWGTADAYVGGIFSDYLVQKLWIGEIPVILMLLQWLPNKILVPKKKILNFFKKYRWLIIGLLVLGVRQLFTKLPMVSLWYFTKVIELGLFAICLKEIWPKISHKLIEYALLITVIFQAGIGILQFVRQQSLFPYRILGETQLTGSINIAQAGFKSRAVVLAYGTTAHPNILAGLTVVFGCLWLWLRLKTTKLMSSKELAMIGLMSVVLFITQSYVAILALGIFLMINAFPQLKNQAERLNWSVVLLAPILLMVLAAQSDSESIFRRAFLNAHAATVLQQQPLIGTGLGLFTTSLNNSPAQELVRFIQPAHNVFLLLMAELGLLGMGVVWLVKHHLNRVFPWQWLPSLLILLSFDHYLVTQWVGGLMLALMLAILPTHAKE